MNKDPREKIRNHIICLDHMIRNVTYYIQYQGLNPRYFNLVKRREWALQRLTDMNNEEKSR